VVLKRGIWWDTENFSSLEAASTNFYQDNRTTNWSLNADYTNQLTQTNLLKTGIRFTYYDVYNNGVAYSFRPSSFVAWSGFAEYYRAYPINFAFYIQDKMEYEGMVANVGARIETYNFQANVPADPFNVFYAGTQEAARGNPETVPSKTQFVILPRAGISFPVGENTAFRIQYGHFTSMPIFSEALVVKNFRGISALGNPNLEPKKTINYEFGLQQVIENDHRLDVALYYNDRVSQVGLQRIAALTGDVRNQEGFTLDNEALYWYQSWYNNSFGSTIGMEVTFENITRRNWSYRLSYNLSQTTNGRYGADVIYPDNTRNLALRGTTGEFLSSYDRTHSFRALIQYFLGDDEGMEIFGFKPFANTIFGLTYLAQSGLPYTYTTTFDLKDVQNNRRYPVESSFDFNFTKEIYFEGDYKLIIGLRIMNVFDNKWLTPFGGSDQDREDRNNWVERGETIDNPADNPTRKSYQLYPFRTYRNVPREIYFTVGFGF
jgi:outer membrane receptor protein involved in Fe transport